GALYDRREYPNGYNFVHLDLAAGQGTIFLRRYDRLRGFHKDTVTTGDVTAGFHRFVLPKELGRPSAPPSVIPGGSGLRAESERPLSVELIRDHHSPDILPALDLYNQRIPDGERFEDADIVRWLRDRPEEHYFFVAKYRGQVCGFTLLHVRAEKTLAFIAYL